MLKFLGILFLLIGSFASGYYFGQRPVGTLQQTVSDLQQSIKDLSRNVLDTTLGVERDLRRRQGLVDAKSRLVQAKAHLLDRNFGDASKELAEAITALEAATKGRHQDVESQAMRELAGLFREARLEMSTGKPVPLKKLDEIQRRLDQLLGK